MWPTAVFGVSFLGLVLLFSLKALELHFNKRTPLHHVRRIGDPLITGGLMYFRIQFRNALRAGFQVCVAWITSAARKTETAFNRTVHSIAARLNRYLRTRRLEMRHGSEVSARLKTVLEKDKDTTSTPDPL